MISIREAGPGDFSSILALNECIPKTASFNWPEVQLAAELHHVRTFLLEQEAELQAFVCCRELPDELEISVLATHPKHRRQGYQRELIKSLQRLAARQQKRILLEVHEKNEAARALYAQLGFVQSFSRKNYYSDGASALLLEWNNKAGCES